MFLRKLFIAAAAVASITTSASLFAADAEYTFKLHHFLPPMSMQHSKVFLPWSEKIAAESNGRIKIELYPTMQLGGKPPHLYDQVRKGVVDMSWTVGGYTPGRFPKTTVFELPFMATNAKGMSMALQEFYESELKDEFEDVHVLSLHTHARGVLHSRDTPISKMEDLQGLKTRAPNKMMAEALELMGANPVFMPVPQMPSALSKGVLNVAVLPYEVIKPLKIHQLVKYHTEFPGERGFYAQFFIFSMNKDAYNSLPDDLKAVIDNNSGMELTAHIGQMFDENELVGREAAVENGNTFIELDEAEIQRIKEKVQPVTDSWIKDHENGQALYDKANELINKYSAQAM